MGCGCGPNQIVVTPKPDCLDCIIAPDVGWTCDQGPHPGDELNFNILTVSGVDLPAEGDYVFQKIGPLPDVVKTYTLSATGDVSIHLKDEFEKEKVYSIAYKIQRLDSGQNNIGYIKFCVRDLCKGKPDNCDEKNGDYVEGFSVTDMVDCAGTEVYNVDLIYDEYFIDSQTDNIDSVVITPSSITIEYSGASAGELVTLSYVLKTGLATEKYIINLTVEDKCDGLVIPGGYSCDSCTGDIVLTTDLEVSGSITPDLEIDIS
jgi:hypothetical protein